MARTDRLTREQWLDHGLQNLAEIGFTALKADTLAKSLGVSRGSFYWHFKNLAEFHTAILQRWQEVMVDAPIKLLETGGAYSDEVFKSAENKLHQLLTLALTSDPSLEQAIRAWAYNVPAVQQIATQIDMQRLAYIQQLLEAIGIETALSHTRAHLIYASYLGQIMLNVPLSAEQQASIIEQLMRLAQPY